MIVKEDGHTYVECVCGYDVFIGKSGGLCPRCLRNFNAFGQELNECASDYYDCDEND